MVGICAVKPWTCMVFGIGVLILVLLLVSWTGFIGSSVLPWKWEIFQGLGGKKDDGGGDAVPSMDNVLEKLVKPYMENDNTFNADLIEVLKTYKKVLEDNKDTPDDFGTDEEEDAYSDIVDLVGDDLDKTVKVLEAAEEKLPADPTLDVPTTNGQKDVVCRSHTDVRTDFTDMDMDRFEEIFSASTKGKKYMEFLKSNYETLCTE